MKPQAINHGFASKSTSYIVPPVCATCSVLKLYRRSIQMQMWACAGCLDRSPGLPVDRMFLVMVTLSSELRAQSTMPLQPFMGKLMSAAAAGRLWMLRTAAGKEQEGRV